MAEDLRQYQTVVLDPFVTDCPGHTVTGMILNIQADQCYVKIDDRCDGCTCGPEARFISKKYLKPWNEGKEVANG